MNIVITGASKGIGKAIAEKFADDKQGHTFFLCSRNIETLQLTGKELQGRFPRTSIYTRQCDVSKKEEVKKFANWVMEQVDRVDILVNNAGPFIPGNVYDEELSEKMNVQFLALLPTRNILFPHTKEILQYLVDKNYELHLITNGFETVQHNKLRYSGLDKFFKEVITSEGSNSIKPNKEIFEYAFQKTNANPATSIMIGDTIEVDILGAMNAGIDQVFVNHTGITTDVKPTYTVSSLKELEEIF